MENIQRPILSISLLVSNRIDTIGKCMESLKPLLEGFPCELVVVDTVGPEKTDGSIAVVRQYTDKIYHFEWCDDFAAARNFGLEKCTGEWFLFMDDDEWFENVGEIIEFFQSGEYKNFKSATYQIRNYTNFEGTDYHMAVLSRMVKRTPKLKFEGRIHEAFSELHLPCKDFSSYVHHYGYVYASEEEKLAHIRRNVVLLEKELKLTPKHLRYRTQMARELACFDNQRALDFCEETFRLCSEEKNSSYFQSLLFLVFRLYEALGKTVAMAEETYNELKQTYGFSETAENAISFQMVRLCLINNQPECAYPYAVTYFETLQYLMENKEIQQIQMAADSYRYQAREARLEMLHFGAYSAWKAGEYAAAWDLYRQMPWEDESFQNEEAFQLMLGLFQEHADVRTMLDILKRVMKNHSLMQLATVRKSIGDILALLK